MTIARRRQSRLAGPQWPPTRTRAVARAARVVCAALMAFLVATPAAWAASWAEVGDAGDTFATAQIPAVAEPVTEITGSIAPTGDADMFRVCAGPDEMTVWTLTQSDPVLIIVRPDGSEFAGADNFAPNSPNPLDAQVGHRAGLPGESYVTIASMGDSFDLGVQWAHTGLFSFDYTLVVRGAEACPGDPPPPPPADTTPPVLSVPNTIVGATAGTGATITYIATATDDVDGVVAPTCSPPSGSVFPIGLTTVRCTATDRAGNTASADFFVSIGGPANQPAGGAPAIDDTTPTETLPLTAGAAGITDPDNTDPARAVDFHYQWRSAADPGATFTDIPGATSPTFTPTQSEVGRVLRVRVSFTDQRGNAEQLESAITRVTGDFIVGTPAADTITGTAGDDIVRGNGGDDTISTVAGDDLIRFSGTAEGFDAVEGGAGRDGIEATADTIIGLRSLQRVERVVGDGANVRIRGTDAADTLDFRIVLLTGIVAIRGGGGDDVITGSSRADVIRGGPGNDTIDAGPGNDVIRFSGTGDGFDQVDGGTGVDRIAAAATGTVIGLRAVTGTEQMSAPAGENVVVRGNAAANTINLRVIALSGTLDLGGGGGNDTLTGTGQGDVIHGDAGNDTINGGAGNDRVALAAGFGADTVLEFDANPTGGQDAIDVTALGITAASFAARVAVGLAPAGGALVTIGPALGTIRLAALLPTAVTASDFLLAP